MDIVMEIVFEVLMEGYIWLMQLIVPGAGEGSKRSWNIATVLSLIGIVVVIGAGIFVCVIRRKRAAKRVDRA